MWLHGIPREFPRASFESESRKACSAVQKSVQSPSNPSNWKSPKIQSFPFAPNEWPTRMTFTLRSLRLDLEPAIFASACHGVMHQRNHQPSLRLKPRKWNTCITLRPGYWQQSAVYHADHRAQCSVHIWSPKNNSRSEVYSKPWVNLKVWIEHLIKISPCWTHIAMTHQWMTPRCMKGQEQRYTSTGAEHSCSLQFKGGQHNLLCMLLVFLVLYVVSLLVIIFLQTLPFWSFIFFEAYAPNSESISRIFSALWLLCSNESRSVSAPLGDDGIQAILVVDLARLTAPQTACFKRPESVYLFLRTLLHPFAKHSWPLCQQQTRQSAIFDANIVQILCV